MEAKIPQKIQKPQKVQAVGSKWNKGSWLWEDRDFTELAQRLIKQRLIGHKFEKNDIKFEFTEVTHFSGDATLLMRRQKLFAVFEQNFQITWHGTDDDDDADGFIKVLDFNHQDMDFQVTKVSYSDETDIADDCKAILKKHAQKELMGLLGNFPEEVLKKEGSQEKFEQMKKEEQDQQKFMEQTKVQTNALQQSLFKEQQEKEKQMKQEFHKHKFPKKE